MICLQWYYLVLICCLFFMFVEAALNLWYYAKRRRIDSILVSKHLLNLQAKEKKMVEKKR